MGGAIDLPRTPRVSAEIVRREIKVPHGHLCKIVDAAQHALRKFGVIQEIERDGGITHVCRADTAVRIVLFGEE